MLTQDIAAVCLVLAGGDFSMDFEQVMLKANEFMEAEDRHFGRYRSDLHEVLQGGGLIALLPYHHPILDRLRAAFKRRRFDGILLGEILPVILLFDQASFTDTESQLMVSKEHTTREEYERRDWLWPSYTWEEYLQRLQMKEEMRRLFSLSAPLPLPKAVKKLMRKFSLDEKVLHRCSRPGEAH